MLFIFEIEKAEVDIFFLFLVMVKKRKEREGKKCAAGSSLPSRDAPLPPTKRPAGEERGKNFLQFFFPAFRDFWKCSLTKN